MCVWGCVGFKGGGADGDLGVKGEVNQYGEGVSQLQACRFKVRGGGKGPQLSVMFQNVQIQGTVLNKAVGQGHNVQQGSRWWEYIHHIKGEGWGLPQGNLFKSLLNTIVGTSKITVHTNVQTTCRSGMCDYFKCPGKAIHGSV